MKKKRIAFAWFDLVKLLQDTSYPDHLATQLEFSDSAKLLEILKDCTDILCVERGGHKNYSNKRKRHITTDDLIVLPSFSKRIKQLCQDNSIEWCVKHYGFDAPSGKFPFEIDRFDLIALHILNYFDDAFAEKQAVTDVVVDSPSLANAIYCWDKLQDKRREEVKSRAMGQGALDYYKINKKHNQRLAGCMSAARNLTLTARTDLVIANMLLLFIYSDQCFDARWNSLSEFVDDWVRMLAEVIDKCYPDFARTLARHNNINRDTVLISLDRLKRVVKQIYYFDNSLISRWIDKPIPAIGDKDNLWVVAMLRLELVWMEEPTFHFKYPQFRDLSDYLTTPHDKSNKQ